MAKKTSENTSKKQQIQIIATSFLLLVFIVGIIFNNTKDDTEISGTTPEVSIETNIDNQNNNESDNAQNTVNSVSDAENNTDEKSEANYDMELHFIDVGQADALLITENDYTMLIDAGNNGDGDYLVSYLKEEGIDQIDYMILTHPHEDHIGGADTILESFQVDTLIMPDKEANTKTYRDVVEAISENGVNWIFPELGETYDFSNASFTIIAPVKSDYGDNLNNYSVGIILVNKNNRVVAYGDGEKEAELDIISTGVDLHADILKIPHHGSSTSSCQDIIDLIQPAYGVIFSEVGNSYHLPNAIPLARYEETDMDLFRTDIQGTIIAYLDGTNIHFNVEPCNNFTPGE